MIAFFMRTPITLALMLSLSNPAIADTICSGSAPDWSVQISDDMSDISAEMIYRGKSTSFSVPHIANALGDPTTKAYSLIADFDTAILLVHPAKCATGPFNAHLMTQDRNQPILLSGCCSKTKQ